MPPNRGGIRGLSLLLVSDWPQLRGHLAARRTTSVVDLALDTVNKPDRWATHGTVVRTPLPTSVAAVRLLPIAVAVFRSCGAAFGSFTALCVTARAVIARGTAHGEATLAFAGFAFFAGLAVELIAGGVVGQMQRIALTCTIAFVGLGAIRREAVAARGSLGHEVRLTVTCAVTGVGLVALVRGVVAARLVCGLVAHLGANLAPRRAIDFVDLAVVPAFRETGVAAPRIGADAASVANAGAGFFDLACIGRKLAQLAHCLVSLCDAGGRFCRAIPHPDLARVALNFTRGSGTWRASIDLSVGAGIGPNVGVVGCGERVGFGEGDSLARPVYASLVCAAGFVQAACARKV